MHNRGLAIIIYMRTLNQNSFEEVMDKANIKSRLKTELKFTKSIENLSDDWAEYELLAIKDRTNDRGILLLEPNDALYIVQYDISRKVIDSKSGRRRAIICDFCYTWQPGSNAASITFTIANTKRKTRFICCGDLQCSSHVRTLTKAALTSRSQLREDMTNETRVLRLKNRLRDKIIQLELVALESADPSVGKK